MSVLLVGLSHKTAPVEVRERFAVAEAATAERLAALAERPGVSEALILSTCNRVELVVGSEAGSDSTESDSVVSRF